ncbi:P-loop containing nucleoside triphosphate hydrolase protein [Hysterangium stoloniferum]|nr:P-loop containing nucleoside triphosphate hydrolase protein [Hysterangium stoloniferum]
MGRNKLKKDPGVPKLPSLKVKNEFRKMCQSVRPQKSHNARNAGEDVTMTPENSLAALAASAETSDPSSSAQYSMDPIAQAKRQYIRTLHRVIEQSDVIILVLDARDPEGCRSKLVEEEVRRRESEGKRLVFVMNKIDLVSQENALAWMRYLRHTAPTIPFRSSTQQQTSNLKSRSSPGLMNLIKSYKTGPSSRITVGVVGYPNVGKSSLINSLKRSKVCAVAAEAGWTRDLQSIQVDRGIRIIDSPGVVFDDIDPESVKGRSGVLLRNVLKVEDVEDPLAVVEEITARTERETLQKIYKLPEWNNMLEFMTMLALSTGRLLKGGSPDLMAAARSVLQDWNANKIPYFSVPPTVHPSSLPSNVPGAENVGEATIVQGGFGAAFDLGALYGEAMQQDSEVAEEEDGAMQEDGNEMESDDLRHVIPRKRSLSITPELELAPNELRPILGKRALTPSEVGGPAQTRPTRAPAPKRIKPTYDTVFNEQERETMGISNPMGRKNLKENMKKKKKAVRRAAKALDKGMVVDDVGDAVEFTFRIPGT